MPAQPSKLELQADGRLRITFSDGTARLYTPRELRDACPCATCRERRNQPPSTSPLELTVLSPAEARPLTLAQMKPVGNYAYGIAFSDGHDTGIYTFDFLTQLGQPAG